MTPSVLAAQMRRGVEDFLLTTFPITSPFFDGVLEALLTRSNGVFRGPYLSIRLPFLSSKSGKRHFPDILPADFVPYTHQESAFERLAAGRSSLIATGTGSGKTEGFLYPILDYCRRHLGERGVKALVIYPMNALATDQAHRFARAIHSSPSLRGHVTAGLFIGGKEAEAVKAMGEERVITDRETMRRAPPDILLTNYKMLDYLLIRPKDFPLWRDNGPETLKLVVVDELHTFDGAQAADLACLLRRVKARVRTPANHLCCVGTSATLGATEGLDIAKELVEYAARVFGEPFEEGCLIGETVQTADEFLAGYEVAPGGTSDWDRAGELDPLGHEKVDGYLSSQHRFWFAEEPGLLDEAWRYRLADRLRCHPYVRDLLGHLDGRARDVNLVCERLGRRLTQDGAGARVRPRDVLDGLVALLSAARVKTPQGEAPLVQVRQQLWMRELRRMVGSVSAKPTLEFADDLTPDDLRRALPVIHCRECGLTGWGGSVRDSDNRVNPDLQVFYRDFFARSPRARFLFPGETPIIEGQQTIETWLCPECLTFEWAEAASPCTGCGTSAPAPLRVWMPETSRTEKRVDGSTRTWGSHDCPACGGGSSLTILGSRAASLTSVLIAQLFTSPFNDDKKLLAFSDSVQDASHRAGFFSARTFTFNFRGALQKVVDAQAGPIPFGDLTNLFWNTWSSRLPVGEFIATFLPPDLDWFRDYEVLRATGSPPPGGRLLDNLRRRIGWEVWSEYTFDCRIGRTLEKTSCSVLQPRRESMETVLDGLLERLRNEIGGLRGLDRLTLQRFLSGLIVALRAKGAVDHPELKAFIEENGNSWLLGKSSGREYRPNFGKFSRAPVFLTSRAGGRFQTLLRTTAGASPTWYEDWVARSFGAIDPAIGTCTREVFEIVVPALVNAGILFERSAKNATVWGLRSEVFEVVRDVAQLRCNRCRFAVSVGPADEGLLVGGPCMKYRCGGKFERVSPGEEYYRRLYRDGDVERVFATEHTGLIDRATRERIEEGFIHRERPGDPNLLSCTPTLEMGINIGDLSTIALCSIPPKPSNYVQRVGRAGRVDGNAFVLAIANARPHDLYFFADPDEMIQGQVEPPGCFLNASAVLERQFTGYVFDRWVESGISIDAIPRKLQTVLDNVERQERAPSSFPWSLISFFETHRTPLEEGFQGMFAGELKTFARERLQAFAHGSREDEAGLAYRIVAGLQEVADERKSLRSRIRALAKRIADLDADAGKGTAGEETMRDLRQERGALNEVVREINDKNVLNFMTDEGLLPNYAFPESGVVLKSILYRKVQKEDSGKSEYESRVYEYVRPASMAIDELAPSNHFYAGGRNVQVDQVNLEVSRLEPWRFCDSCSHMEREGETELRKSCPRCESPLWSDEGQRREMLRMRQVMSTCSEMKARSHDESDDREPGFFNKNLFVVKDDADITAAFAVDREEVPFGFEFFRKLTLRDVNLGPLESAEGIVSIAGRRMAATSFILCSGCGKVRLDGGEDFRHALYCRYSGKEEKEEFFSACYLYREFTSEAIRMLLPVSAFEIEMNIHSFVAALDLGLRKRFRGDPGHLLTTTYDEPIRGSDARKRYLVLYDGVPGGTGYLKELMSSPDSLMEVFQNALDVLAACGCQADPKKDGCYRCLLAYRGRHDQANTSRRAAMALLRRILDNRQHLKSIAKLADVRLNTLLESELEGLFIEALRRPIEGEEDRQLSPRLVNGKPGFYLRVGDAGWLIEPQVPLGPREGVQVESRADFVLYPERPKGELPIAVFTDGYEFHADPHDGGLRLGQDMAQRMAILRSGRFHVWALTWWDVDDVLNRKDTRTPMLLGDAGLLRAALSRADGAGVGEWMAMAGLGSFRLLLRRLGRGRGLNWQTHARCLLASMRPAKCDADRVQAAIEIMTDPHGRSGDSAWAPEVTAGDGANWYLGDLRHPREGSPVIVRGLVHGTGALETLGAVFRLHEEAAQTDERDWRATWREFIRAMNLLQFASRVDFVTSRGLAEGRYGGLLFDPFAPPAAPPPAMEGLVADLRPHLRPAVLQAIREGHLPSATGYGIPRDGEILAECEVAWEDLKVAILVEEQEVGRPHFERDGWRVLSAASVVSDPQILIDELAAGGGR